MKIKWFFVIILLLVSFTLIESGMRGVVGRGFRIASSVSHTSRSRSYYPRSSSGNYGKREGVVVNEHKEKWIVLPLPPPDRSLMENPERLNYLAANRKDGKSNIGRLLSGI